MYSVCIYMYVKDMRGVSVNEPFFWTLAFSLCFFSWWKI